MFVIWDRSVVVHLSDEKKKLLKDLKEGDQVEVKGKWSIWINRKSGQHKPSFLLTSVVKAGDPAGGDEFPVEKEFNFEDSDESVMLQYLQHQKDLKKLDEKAK